MLFYSYIMALNEILGINYIKMNKNWVILENDIEKPFFFVWDEREYFVNCILYPGRG